ncbi:MAG: hypothetical protein KatS3mg115_2451 [Candidatus Poribacteria bacterium]|nr:MAG: hypothetical protein KatS3mg115_2451 [Candidatus Poribacteria bacterium]
MPISLTWSVDSDSWRFVLSEEGEPSSAIRGAYVLYDLVDNGQARKLAPCVFEVSHGVISDLDEADQYLLGLPSRYPFDVYVFLRGNFSEREATFALEFREHREGSQLPGERIGCLLRLRDGTEYLLSRSQWELCELIEEFNALPPLQKSLETNLCYFDRIKRLAVQAQAWLHPHLNAEEVCVPDKLQIDVLQRGEDLELLPEVYVADREKQLSEEDQREFQRQFDRFWRIQGVYAIPQPDSGRVRIVLTQAQRRELMKIKKFRRVGGKAKEQLVRHPETIFDPDVVDLDQFSDRVIAIGEYQPRFYPFISPYQSQWIPGILIEKGLDRQRIEVQTLEELSRLEKAIQEGERLGRETIEFKGEQIPLPVAKDVAKAARKVLVSEPGKRPRPPAPNQKDVLIIVENIESLDYTLFEGAQEPLPHEYESPPRIKAGVQVLDHQREGIAWLEALFRRGYAGALLADDMGLGKTFQVLGFLDWHQKNHNQSGNPYLVVAPLTLMENWKEECFKFFSPLPFTPSLVQGRSGKVSEIQKGSFDRPYLVITTYETLRRRQLELCAVDWAVTVLDEAQRIKTPGTLITNAAKALKSGFRIAVTGTPVENTLVDLWCIVDYLAPGLLGSLKEFAREYQNPLRSDEVDLRDLGERLRARLEPLFKRRLKNDVLEGLPKKHVHLCDRLMPQVQRDAYVDAIRRGRGRTDRGEMLKVIGELRRISDHPFLERWDVLSLDASELIGASAKLQTTVEILEDVRQKGEKAIVFSEFKLTQRLLQHVFRQRFGVIPSIINGEVSSSAARLTTIARFEGSEGFNVLILSPRAAGVGLNITAANHVLHYSRHWNPAKEDQATDRAYRIGQERDVHVYYPRAVTEEFKSFDVLIHELLERKRALAQSVLFPTEMVEVDVAEFYQGLVEGEGPEPPLWPLTLHEVDRLDPFLFEALVAVLWNKEGYEVVLTPRSGDHGADVVALRGAEGLLIQVKHSTRAQIGESAIRELLHARSYYEHESLFTSGRVFQLLVVTNREFDEPARDLALRSGVCLCSRADLETLLQKHRPTEAEVVRMDETRRPL